MATTHPKELATKSCQSALRLVKHWACIISNSPPYKTPETKNTIIHNFDRSYFKTTKNNKLHNIKNIDACTHLSKLNNSSQLALGINWPGVAHKAKIMVAHINAKTGLFL